MRVFGGLINCVRTFGNQVVNDVKNFIDGINISYSNNNGCKINSQITTLTITNLTSVYNGKETQFQVITSNSSSSIKCVHPNTSLLNLSEDVSSPYNASVAFLGSVYRLLTGKVCLYPDYANAVDLSKADGTVADNGWLLLENNGYSHSFQINGGATFATINSHGSNLIPVKAGDTYTNDSWTTVASFQFIPNRW